MPVLTAIPSRLGATDVPFIATDTPILFEDEGQEEMGESKPHTVTVHIVYYGLISFFSHCPSYEVFSNLDLHYSSLRPDAYFSSDVMVVTPFRPLPDTLPSYSLGVQGPAPEFVVEVLSHRSAQQGDLTMKPLIYADLEVPEYCLIDPTGEYLPSRLELRKLVGKRKWATVADGGQGISSKLGFRIILEPDGRPRIIDAITGERIPRPDEAIAYSMAKYNVEAELARLRALLAEKK
jgi:hypothetical protein